MDTHEPPSEPGSATAFCGSRRPSALAAYIGSGHLRWQPHRAGLLPGGADGDQRLTYGPSHLRPICTHIRSVAVLSVYDGTIVRSKVLLCPQIGNPPRTRRSPDPAEDRASRRQHRIGPARPSLRVARMWPRRAGKPIPAPQRPAIGARPELHPARRERCGDRRRPRPPPQVRERSRGRAGPVTIDLRADRRSTECARGPVSARGNDQVNRWDALESRRLGLEKSPQGRLWR